MTTASIATAASMSAENTSHYHTYSKTSFTVDPDKATEAIHSLHEYRLNNGDYPTIATAVMRTHFSLDLAKEDGALLLLFEFDSYQLLPVGQWNLNEPIA